MKVRSLKNKKGQVSGLGENVVQLGIASIVLVLMLVILGSLVDTDAVRSGTNCTAANSSQCDLVYGSANETLGGLGTFGDFWTIIVLAVVAAVVIGVIFGVFGRSRSR